MIGNEPLETEAIELSPEQLAKLTPVPSGAAAVAGIAVGLMLLGWLLIYIAIYLPRGMIG